MENIVVQKLPVNVDEIDYSLIKYIFVLTISSWKSKINGLNKYSVCLRLWAFIVTNIDTTIFLHVYFDFFNSEM
jgi:hypothetical protein